MKPPKKPSHPHTQPTHSETHLCNTTYCYSTYQHEAITSRSRQLLMMGTWLPETCWATIRKEIKNTKKWHLVSVSCPHWITMHGQPRIRSLWRYVTAFKRAYLYPASGSSQSRLTQLHYNSYSCLVLYLCRCASCVFTRCSRLLVTAGQLFANHCRGSDTEDSRILKADPVLAIYRCCSTCLSFVVLNDPRHCVLTGRKWLWPT